MYGLLILNFVIPFVMIFVGYILKKHPVKDMNSGNGYNTPSSRKSQEHWDYAQSIAPNIFIGIGKTLGLVEIVLCISLLFLNISAQSTVFAGVEPLPDKRTVKKYKVFPVSSHMCCWPLFMRQDRVCAFPSGSTHPDYAAPV